MRSPGLLSTCVLLCVACGEPADPGAPPAPPAEQGKVKAPTPPASGGVTHHALNSRAEHQGPLFTLRGPDHTGIAPAHPLDLKHPMRFLYYSGTASGGVALGDVDGDDQLDVFIASGPRGDRLYRQTGGLKFEDITAQSPGLDGGESWSTGAAFVDLDADGDLDLYVTRYDSPNGLYINDGKGRFTESAKAWGLDLTDAFTTPAFADYDNDGDLDVYLLTYRYFLPEGFPEKMPIEMVDNQQRITPAFQKYLALVKQRRTGEISVEPIARPDRLLRNEGDRFVEVTAEAGISKATGHGLSVTWWDHDLDGDLDLYVGNDFKDGDRFYENQGDGTFTEISEKVLPHTSWFSMGADVADFNNDGLLDLLSADMSATTHYWQKVGMGNMSDINWFLTHTHPPQYMKNALYLNTGMGRFMEVAELTGMADTDWTWSVRAGDFDLDGRTDVFFTNGVARSFNHSDHPETIEGQIGRTQWDLHEKGPTRPEQNLAFRNLGEMRFEPAAKDWGLDFTGMSYTAAQGDLDQDGDLDLVVINLDGPPHLYENQSDRGLPVVVELRGQGKNRRGVGARVVIEAGGVKQTRIMNPYTGFMASNDPRLHFGIDAAWTLDRVTVYWPSGAVQVLTDQPVSQRLVITEPAQGKAPATDQPKPLFAPAKGTVVNRLAAHKEQQFDDFGRQPLLPNRMSQWGPGLAVSDVDGDGQVDVFLGGAAGSPAQLITSKGQPQTIFTRHAVAEDMGAVFFDFEGDGDRDLYVVSGGAECTPGASDLQDRLYINDAGSFLLAEPGTLPKLKHSGGPVAAADFDGDGDLDLFVGGRQIPGQYPLTPESHLLLNDNGRMVEVTNAWAPGLKTTGLVTGALWSDANGDGRLDLLVSHEWGPLKLYINTGKALEDQTEASGLAEITGWFNGVVGGDVDGDGDIDYVATNFGLNTKYHASKATPASLYYGAFDQGGPARLVEAEMTEEGTAYTIRGRSCLSNAIDGVRNKYDSFDAFAQDPLEGIFGEQNLRKARKHEINTLESGVFLNDGQGRFTFKALPHLAQGSPAYGVVLTELNGDGHPDLFLAQNFNGAQVETGHLDGGVGLLLTGSASGQFTTRMPRHSGVVVSGDATAAVATDLNGDAWPDLVVARNGDTPLAFAGQPRPEAHVLALKLAGKPGNPDAVGARITVTPRSAPAQTAEVYAGSGYLGHGGGLLFFGLGATRAVERIEVRWPDGTTSQTTEIPADGVLRLSQDG